MKGVQTTRRKAAVTLEEAAATVTTRRRPRGTQSLSTGPNVAPCCTNLALLPEAASARGSRLRGFPAKFSARTQRGAPHTDTQSYSLLTLRPFLISSSSAHVASPRFVTPESAASSLSRFSQRLRTRAAKEKITRV